MRDFLLIMGLIVILALSGLTYGWVSESPNTSKRDQ